MVLPCLAPSLRMALSYEPELRAPSARGLVVSFSWAPDGDSLPSGASLSTEGRRNNERAARAARCLSPRKCRLPWRRNGFLPRRTLVALGLSGLRRRRAHRALLRPIS